MAGRYRAYLWQPLQKEESFMRRDWMAKRKLVLEDGTIFAGIGFGSETYSTGEIVINTGMSGYHEAITNPSCCGQIVRMTYPLIANYAINCDDYDTLSAFINRLVVHDLTQLP